jgi:hypothetical protein
MAALTGQAFIDNLTAFLGKANLNNTAKLWYSFWPISGQNSYEFVFNSLLPTGAHFIQKVGGVQITNAGSGYVSGEVPTVTFTSLDGGTGASGTAVMSTSGNLLPYLFKEWTISSTGTNLVTNGNFTSASGWFWNFTTNNFPNTQIPSGSLSAGLVGVLSGQLYFSGTHARNVTSNSGLILVNGPSWILGQVDVTRTLPGAFAYFRTYETTSSRAEIVLEPRLTSPIGTKISGSNNYFWSLNDSTNVTTSTDAAYINPTGGLTIKIGPSYGVFSVAVSIKQDSAFSGNNASSTGVVTDYNPLVVGDMYAYSISIDATTGNQDLSLGMSLTCADVIWNSNDLSFNPTGTVILSPEATGLDFRLLFTISSSDAQINISSFSLKPLGTKTVVDLSTTGTKYFGAYVTGANQRWSFAVTATGATGIPLVALDNFSLWSGFINKEDISGLSADDLVTAANDQGYHFQAASAPSTFGFFDSGESPCNINSRATVTANLGTTSPIAATNYTTTFWHYLTVISGVHLSNTKIADCGILTVSVKNQKYALDFPSGNTTINTTVSATMGWHFFAIGLSQPPGATFPYAYISIDGQRFSGLINPSGNGSAGGGGVGGGGQQ